LPTRLAEQGEPLTADKLSEIFLDFNKKYYGDVVDDRRRSQD
jgi:oligoendopeptidase F